MRRSRGTVLCDLFLCGYGHQAVNPEGGTFGFECFSHMSVGECVTEKRHSVPSHAALMVVANLLPPLAFFFFAFSK